MNDLTLADETRLAVAGDWHGSVGWVQNLLPALHRAAPDVKSILHVGDFGFWPERQGKTFATTVDYWCRVAGIERVLVTPGNHEWWTMLDDRFAARLGEPIRMSESVWVLPRGFRFVLAGKSFLSFGGAASVDFADRVPGRAWWPQEMPTEREADAAAEGGAIDVLLTHETVDGGTVLVDSMLRVNPHGWDEKALAYSALSRARVTRLWERTKPKVLIHGHMHISDEITLRDGRRVYSLGRDGQPRNLGLLELQDLGWEWL